MSSVNKVIIVGRLGNDPETRQFQNGGGVTNISVATSERWTDKNTGERKEQTEWHRISLFNRLGEIAAQYLRKGSMVYVEGSLQTRKYTDQQGVERYSTEIRASEMRMLSSNNEQGGGYGNQGGNNYGNNFGGYQNQNNQQWGNNQNRGFNQNQGYQQGQGFNDYNQGGQDGFGGHQGGNFGQNPNAQVQNSFAGKTPAQSPRSTQNNMATNNSFGAPSAAPKAESAPPAAKPAASNVEDDDIPF